MEEGDEEAYEEAYEDAALSFASSNMFGPPLVREYVARRPSSPLAVDDSTTARDRSIDDGQGANSAKGGDDDDDDDDSSFTTMPPRPCNPTADVRRGVSSCGRGGCAWGGWDGRSWGQQQSVRARAPDLRRSERGPRTAGEDERQVARGAVERARDEEGRRRRRPRIGRVVADSKHESGQQTGRILP